MTKEKNTKRALFTSVLSMMLCMAMLVGSTFAWFTDSVTSGKNRIVAGNLDVELYYNNASTNGWTDASVANVAEPNFFVDKDGKDICWEPGVMAVTQFKVANKGSLALKYSLETLKADFNTWNGRDLSDVIKFAVIDNKNYTVGTTTRDDIIALNPEFDDFTRFKPTGHLLPKDKATVDEPSEKIFTVVAYWKPNVVDDNLYNVNNGAKLEKKDKDGADRLYIDIEIQLMATQYNYEYDSFNNTYDAGLSPEQNVNTARLISEGYKAVNSPEDLNNVTGTKIFLNHDITTSTVWNVTSAELTEIDLNGYSFNNAVVVNNGANLTITDSLGGGSIDKVDVKKGTLTLENCTLTKSMNVSGGAELIIKGGKCTTTLNTAAMESTAPKITIEDGEFSGGDYDMIFLGMNSILVINGGKFNGKSSFWNTIGSDANITISGGTFENLGIIGVAPDTQFTIEDGTFTNLGTFRLRRGNEITINGGTFAGTLGFSIQNQSEASKINVTINGGDYSQANFSNNFGDEQKIVIYNGLFNFDPTTATGVKLGDDSGNTYVTANGNGTWSVATMDEDDFEDAFGE